MASGYRKKGNDDVWDWNIYDSKGDRFSRGESFKPRVYKTGQRMDGSNYIRRIRTDEAKHLDISTLVKDLRAMLEKEGTPEQLEAQMRRPWYWDARANALHFEAPKSAQRLEVSVTRPQLGGVRFWWLCPHCEERCTRLYAVMVAGLPNYGCRTCLGLTYPSQARHKTRAYDRALAQRKVGVNTGVSLKTWCEATRREAKRELRMVWELDRLMGTSFSLGLKVQALTQNPSQNPALKGFGSAKARRSAPKWSQARHALFGD